MKNLTKRNPVGFFDGVSFIGSIRRMGQRTELNYFLYLFDSDYRK